MSRFKGQVVLLLALLLQVSLVSTANAAGAETVQFRSDTSSTIADRHYSCAGVRIVKSDKWIKDSETCLVTGRDATEFVPGIYQSTPAPWNPNLGIIAIPDSWLPTLTPGSFLLWFSDKDRLVAKSFTITIVDNGDGTRTMLIAAYY